jgi:hypothetical protein
LRIRREEELPVFERLGDVRAVTMCQIANILVSRDDLDEALQILRYDETRMEVSLQRHENFEILIRRKFRRRSADMADMAKEVFLKTERKKTVKFSHQDCVASWQQRAPSE